jgi:hypothetical protein
MKAPTLAGFIVLLVATAASACTCVDLYPPVPVCEQVKTKRASLFLGKVEHIGFKTVLLPPDNFPVKMQVVTFEVLQTFGSAHGTKLVVTDWAPGNGSCGFRFVRGQMYLVDASVQADDNALHLNSCGHTAEVSEAEDLVRFLRSVRGNDGAIIFGTVKEYIGEKNFVATRNKPIPGVTVIARGVDGNKVVVTNSDGWYFIPQLGAGGYTVQVELSPQYRPAQPYTFALSSGGCAQVDFRSDRVTP